MKHNPFVPASVKVHSSQIHHLVCLFVCLFVCKELPASPRRPPPEGTFSTSALRPAHSRSLLSMSTTLSPRWMRKCLCQLMLLCTFFSFFFHWMCRFRPVLTFVLCVAVVFPTFPFIIVSSLSFHRASLTTCTAAVSPCWTVSSVPLTSWSLARSVGYFLVLSAVTYCNPLLFWCRFNFGSFGISTFYLN